MKEKPKEKMNLLQALRNNIYVMKLGSQISRSRVIHTFITKVFFYFEWIFFSAYFLKYIVNALDTGKAAKEIFLFILSCGVLFFGINLYRDYMENVVIPLTDTRIYHGVYLRLYQKRETWNCAAMKMLIFITGIRWPLMMQGQKYLRP